MAVDATILFAAGGTGGHILPALAVLKKLENRLQQNDAKCKYNLEFSGGGAELELEIYKKNNLKYVVFPSSGVSGKGIFGTLGFIKNFTINFFRARRYLKRNKVKFVVGFGGYPSVVPILAAASLHIPRCIFEQNGLFGKANSFLSLFTKKVFAVPYAQGTVFEEFTPALNPVRPEIKQIPNSVIKSNISDVIVLVLGGSQGAVSLNTAVMESYDVINSRGIELHIQTGKRDFERVSEICAGKSNVFVHEFIDNMPAMLEKADLIICRAGAGTVSEITEIKKPAIFVPLAIAQGHQKHNCEHLVNAYAAIMYEQDLELPSKLKKFFQDVRVEDLQKMHEAFDDVTQIKGVADGAELISDFIYQSITEAKV